MYTGGSGHAPHLPQQQEQAMTHLEWLAQTAVTLWITIRILSIVLVIACLALIIWAYRNQ